MKRFNIGDAVVVVGSSANGHDIGYCGVITTIKPAFEYDYEVEFDKVYGFTHDGCGHKEQKYRWYNDDQLASAEVCSFVAGDSLRVTTFANKVIKIRDLPLF